MLGRIGDGAFKFRIRIRGFYRIRIQMICIRIRKPAGNSYCIHQEAGRSPTVMLTVHLSCWKRQKKKPFIKRGDYQIFIFWLLAYPYVYRYSIELLSFFSAQVFTIPQFWAFVHSTQKSGHNSGIGAPNEYLLWVHNMDLRRSPISRNTYLMNSSSSNIARKGKPLGIILLLTMILILSCYYAFILYFICYRTFLYVLQKKYL